MVTPVGLGTIQSVPIGTGFTFPTRANVGWSVVNLALSITESSPTARTLTYNWHAGPGGGTSLNFFGDDFLAFALPPNPEGFRYTHIGFTIDPFGPQSRALTVSSAPGSVSITANVGLVPEPSSILLLGTGLVGVLFAVAVSLISAVTLSASDVSGTWQLEMRWSGDMKSTGDCTLKQDGDKLSGTCGTEHSMVTGQTKGNRLSWQVDVTQDGSQGTMKFDGELDERGMTISGSCSIVGGQSGTFTMRKQS
jgi:hypothetical protein